MANEENLNEEEVPKKEKKEAKYFSQANVDYLLTQLTERIKESRMGE